MQVMVAGQTIENAIEETVSRWLEKHPVEAKKFNEDMKLLRDGFRAGALGAAAMEIPETLFLSIATRLKTGNRPNMLWTRDPQCMKIFKRTFLIGCTNPSRPV